MAQNNKRVGVIGLGSMGIGIAQSLLREGFDVAGADVVEAQRERFRQAGGRAVAQPREAAEGASAVFSVVVNAAQNDAVLFGEGGSAEAMAPGTVFVSCCTVDPAYPPKTAARLAERGVLYLDAPISGGAVKAAAGRLTVMGAGAPEAFAAAEPALAAVAEKVFRIADRPGPGSAVKLINQLLAGVHIAAASEAMALAAKLGLDLPTVYEVITASAGNSWMFENRVPHILEGDYQPRSAVNIFTKDLGIVVDSARANQFPVPIAGAAMQMFLMAAAAGMGRDDDASVVRVYQKLAGIELPTQD
ncbi:MAG: NAD-binding protein [Acidobacteria bacterium]|nr:NAD-binding protein [Acidobacteriota bacterium]